MRILSELMRLEKMHRQLLSLSQAMKGVLGQKNYEAFDDVWDRRGKLFKQMQALQSALEPSFASWGRTLEALGPHGAAQAEKLVAEIRRLAQSTLEIDRQAAEDISGLMSGIKDKMQRLDKGRKVVAAYRRPIDRSRVGPRRISTTG